MRSNISDKDISSPIESNNNSIDSTIEILPNFEEDLSGEIPFEIKNRIFFNTFPIIHIIILIIGLLWNFNLISLNLTFLVFLPVIGICFIIKGIYISFQFQLEKTPFNQVLKK
jgi:hypothetical protein